jgi:hypothetical protein
MVPGEVSVEEVLTAADQLAPLGVGARLPLLHLAVSSLRLLPTNESRAFVERARALIMADGVVTPFEHLILVVLKRHLTGELQGATHGNEIWSMRALEGELSTVLSMLARVGIPDEKKAFDAFELGCSRLGEMPKGLTFVPATACGYDAVQKSLDRLALAAPPVKRQIMMACAVCAATDQEITIEEAELLRAVSMALDCPLPPMVADE